MTPVTPPPNSPLSALVLESDDRDAISMVSALTSAGFTVTLTDNFDAAKALIAAQPPFVLIAPVRLGHHHGLELTRQTAAPRPMRVLLTNAVRDTLLQSDVEREGATYVVKPVPAHDLVAAVYRTVLRSANSEGILEPVRPPFERRKRERRLLTAVLIDAERRRVDRRGDVTGLVLRAAM